MRMRTPVTRRLLGAVAVVSALALGATACGSGGTDDASGSAGPKDVAAALEKGGKVTVWAWEPTLKKVAEDFEKKYPKVDVELVNAGTGDKQYTALQNAIAAGSGAPDVAQIEYYALGQFAIGKSVENLAPYGADKHASGFTPARGTPSTGTGPSTPCPWTPVPWRSSTTRRSSTGTASPCRPPGTSTWTRPAPSTRPIPSSSSPTTPVTPASPPA